MSAPQTSESTPPVTGGREPAKMSVGHAALWAMAGQYASFVILFATSVIISRYFLGPDEVGLFSIALATALLLAVLQDFGLTRYIAGLPHLNAEEISRCSSVALIFSLVVAGLIALSAWPLAWVYDLPDLAPLLLIIAASYVFVPLSVVPMALMSRVMRFSGHFAVNVGGALIHALVALALAAMDFSAFSLAWATVAAALGKGVIAQVLQPAAPVPFRLDGIKPIIGFGSKTSALYITGALGTRTPDMIVGKLVDLIAVGLFSRATSLAGQFRMLIAGAIGSVFYPAFARIRDNGEPMGPAYLRVCAGYSALVLPGMAFLALAAEPVVLLLYGPEWVGTAALLSFIALQSGLMLCLPLVTELPILVGQINRLILFNIVETVVSILLLVLGSYWAGAWGAAASRLVYAFCFYAIYMHFIAGVVEFRIGAWVAIMAKSTIVSLATIAPLALVYAFWVGPAEAGIVAMIVASMAAAVTWLGAMIAVRHPALTDLQTTALPIVNRLSPKLGRFMAPRTYSMGDSL